MAPSLPLTAHSRVYRSYFPKRTWQCSSAGPKSRKTGGLLLSAFPSPYWSTFTGHFHSKPEIPSPATFTKFPRQKTWNIMQRMHRFFLPLRLSICRNILLLQYWNNLYQEDIFLCKIYKTKNYEEMSVKRRTSSLHRLSLKPDSVLRSCHRLHADRNL